MNHIDLVKTLQNLEPVFIEAGQLAYKMQKSAKHHNKRETGNPVGDIVTEADLAVQEFLLQAMVKTDLVQCRLFAEEDTLLTKNFNEQGKFYLSIDPIDGTLVYSRGGKDFSVIVSLHDGEKYLYIFAYYPAWNLTHKIINGIYTTSGEIPELSLPHDLSNTILYWSGNPEAKLPKEIYNELKNKGVEFKNITDVTLDFSTINMFAYGKIRGLYCENPNAYDAFMERAIAEAKGWSVYTGGIDLRDIRKRDSGLYYTGYYLALNEL